MRLSFQAWSKAHGGDYAERCWKHSQPCDLLVAHVVCKVERGALWVIRVINDASTLKKGMKVGALFTDIEIDEVRKCIEEGKGTL